MVRNISSWAPCEFISLGESHKGNESSGNWPQPKGNQWSQMVKENHLYLNNTMTILNKHSPKDRERYLLIIVSKDVLGLELYFDQNLIYYVYSSCFFFFPSSCYHNAFSRNGKNGSSKCWVLEKVIVFKDRYLPLFLLQSPYLLIYVIFNKTIQWQHDLSDPSTYHSH